MKRLTELRKEKGLLQIHFCKQIGMSQANISHYELGKREPNISTLKKMATYFNVSIDYLVGYSDER